MDWIDDTNHQYDNNTVIFSNKFGNFYTKEAAEIALRFGEEYDKLKEKYEFLKALCEDEDIKKVESPINSRYGHSSYGDGSVYFGVKGEL